MAKLAPSLLRLRNEVDARWPNRDKASDGWLGDASHAARQSEHNPDSKGMVHAIDITQKGINVDELLNAVIKHPAVWYVIANRKIYSRTHGWVAQSYTGSNPHTKHVHISINLTNASENNRTPFFKSSSPVPTPTPNDKFYVVKAGDNLSKIGEHFGIDWHKIHAANATLIGTNPNHLEIGWKLRIP